MGITAEFKQVSPYLLEKLKKHPDFVELLFNAQYLPESPFWHEFTINPDDPDDVEWFDEFTLFATETLEKLKQEKPEEFEKLKADIPLILTEGKDKYLDVDKTWDTIHFLLTGYDYSFIPPFLIGENEEDHLPSINAVLSGTEIEYDAAYGKVRYLSANQVKQIADALSTFTHANISQRLKQRGWQEESYDYLFEYTYNPLVRYYQDAAHKGNAMFLYLT